MKDLDFDELDKAVNSLMTQTSDSNTQPEQASAPAPSQATAAVATSNEPGEPVSPSAASDSSASSQSPTLASADAASTAAPSPETPPVPSPTSSVPARRSGRFMDVVHPSSDMTGPVAAKSPLRQGTTLTPINADVTPETQVASEQDTPSSAADSSEQTSSSPALKSTEVQSPSTSEWPDPLDMHTAASESDQEQRSVSSSPVVQETAPVATPTTSRSAPVASSPVSQGDSSPVSPFLTDAKVEKRPLGGTPPLQPSSDQKEAPVSETNDTSSQPDTTSPTDDKPAMQSQPLPAELHTDVLKIESNEHVTTPSSPVADTATPPISIAQQYKQQPRSGDQSHAAVYDNAAQPLTHPHKEKSNWLVYVIIVLIILLGAGGAAVLFYLGYI